jgi:hypothetical protein
VHQFLGNCASSGQNTLTLCTLAQKTFFRCKFYHSQIEGGGGLVVTEAGVLLVNMLVNYIVLQIVRQKNFSFASLPQLESCVIGISIE